MIAYTKDGKKTSWKQSSGRNAKITEKGRWLFKHIVIRKQKQFPFQITSKNNSNFHDPDSMKTSCTKHWSHNDKSYSADGFTYSFQATPMLQRTPRLFFNAIATSHLAWWIRLYPISDYWLRLCLENAYRTIYSWWALAECEALRWVPIGIECDTLMRFCTICDYAWASRSKSQNRSLSKHSGVSWLSFLQYLYYGWQLVFQVDYAAIHTDRCVEARL